VIENPIESNSPEIKSNKNSTSMSRLNRQANTSAMEKNLETMMFELDTEDLELLEKRVSELETYIGIENMDIAYYN